MSPFPRRIALVGAVLLAVGLAGGVRGADDYKVSAYLQPDRGVTEERPVQFVLAVDGGGSPQVSPPKLSGLVNLRVISGPNTSSSFVFRNGRTSSEFKLIWTLLPGKPGKASVPGLTVKIGAETYRTEPIEITVGASGSATPAPDAGGRPGRSNATEEADVFLQAELGVTDAWVGQTVPLSVTLFAAQQISGPRWVSQPEFGSFWVESVDVDGGSYQRRMRNRVYTVYPAEAKILVPTTAGEFEIDPFVIQAQVRVGSSDPFDFFSFGRTRTIVRKSQPLKIKVRSLPSKGRTADFLGAVGTFRLDAALDRTETAVNDAVAVRLTVEGEGSLRGVGAPAFPGTPELKVFDPEISDSREVRRGKILSRRTWEWVLVPLAPGEVSLPEFRFSFFNPATEAYEVARAGALKLAVRPGDPRAEAPASAGGSRLARPDLQYIKALRGPLRESSPRAHQRGLFVLLLLLPFAAVPLAVVLGRQRARLRQDRGLARARRARQRARKRFHAIRAHVDDQDGATFHEEVARTLVEYVADRFDRSAAGLTYDLADELLVARQVAPELRRRFRTCLETCDFARFVPASGKAERRTEVLEEARSLVESLERAL